VTAAPGTGVPFVSVYRALSTADSATGYTANENIIKTAAGVKPTYANLSAALAIREDSEFYSEGDELIIAHPAFRQTLREMKDDDGRLIYATNPALGQPETLFGLPLVFTRGAKTSAVATATPTGNPLVIFGNATFLNLGVRSGPESVVIDGRDGTSAMTDETLIKMRARRAFVVGHPDAFAIVEQLPAA
jgi:HK97 family phage major capsid protein